MEHDAENAGEHRNIARLLAVLDALSQASAEGLRLTDVMDAAGLGKTTAHRILNGLAAHGLADQDPESRRYFIGLKMLSWANTARDRFSFARFAEPALLRLSRQTSDTVYLVVRLGDEIVCTDAREGSFPIRVLTLNVGDRRPLGIGAGSLSILACLSDEEVDAYFARNGDMLTRYPFDEVSLREMIAAARKNGYAYNNIHVLHGMENMPGMAGIGLAIRRRDGVPVAALHLTAITSRLDPPRRDNIVAALRNEVERIEREAEPVLDAMNDRAADRRSR
jgi:DNA-binding IclR family transcriptional regulator